MNIGIPNRSKTLPIDGVAQNNPAANVRPKTPVPTDESLEVSATQSGIVASLRETAAGQAAVRPEMVRKGSALLADPNYPPLDRVNSIANLIIDDFILNKNELGPL